MTILREKKFGLLSDSKKPLIASRDISCFKVFLKIRRKYYVCPPGYNYFIQNKYLIPKEVFSRIGPYQTGKIYRIDTSMDSEKDYRIDGEVGEGFFHTYCELEDARKFKDLLLEKSNSNNDLYTIPRGSELVILNSIIPKGSLYYKGDYKQMSVMSYASNVILYKEEVKDIRNYYYSRDPNTKKMKKIDIV